VGIIDKSPVVRPYGRYGFQPVAGFVEFEPSTPYTEAGKELIGAPICPHYLYGSVRSEDGKRYHVLIRHFQHDVAVSLLVYSSDVGQDFDRPVFGYRGLVANGQREGKWGFWQDMPQPRSFYLEDGTSCHWFEKGVVDLKGKLVGDCWQFAIPDVQSPLVYTNRCFKAEGATVRGDIVSGYFFHDTMHLGVGKGWMTSEYYAGLELGWVVFVTEFEDGNIHKGNFVWGKENWNLAIIDRTDGERMIASNVDVHVESDKDNFAEHALFDLGDGEIWEWHAVPGARLPLQQVESFTGPYWREGVVLRRGETRKWVHSDAWIETFREGGLP
jgi:hypothetical protein